MVFSNANFLFLFFPIVLILYYIPIWWKLTTFRNIILLAASLVFYAWGEPIYVALMILSIFVNYLFGLWVNPYNKGTKDKKKIATGKKIVALSCVYNLSFLFVFKYFDWLFTSLHISDKPLLGLALPIGISFYTFQAMSYVIDVYRGKDKVQKNIINVGLYIAFFPQLIAGPIVRYGSIAEQLNKREHSLEKFAQGAWRFVIGLSKKIIIANQLAPFADHSFADAQSGRTVVMAWAGALAFMLQLYFDFSGYSDMAIGLGKMFGFEFNENFNYPYISKSVTEYWRRWHISLGEWFRDYLFYPLSMGSAVKIKKAVYTKTKDRKKAGMVSNGYVLLIVWLATGIWHGANWTFVIWGLIQFVFIYWEQYRKPIKNEKLGAVIGFVSTFLIVLIAKVIFKSNTLTDAGHYYLSMLGLAGNRFVDGTTVYWLGQYGVLFVAGLFLSFPILKTLLEKIDKTEKTALIAVKNAVLMLVMAALLVVDAAYAVGGGYNPFIYFNF